MNDYNEQPQYKVWVKNCEYYVQYTYKIDYKINRSTQYNFLNQDIPKIWYLFFHHMIVGCILLRATYRLSAFWFPLAVIYYKTAISRQTLR